MRALRRLWRSTFGIVALVGGCFALATLIIGVLAYAVTHEALEVQLDHRIAIETRALLHEGQNSPAGVAAAIRRREAASSTASPDYLLVDRAGRRLAGRLDVGLPLWDGYLELTPYRRDGETRIAQSLTSRLPDGSQLIVAADRAAIDEMDATLLVLFVGAFGLMLLLGIGAAWLVGTVTRSRLARIDRAALAIIDGDLARRIPLSGADDEFDRVSATLNRMLDRIGGLMDNLRQVSSDVAHDLRTPLTRLHNRLDEAMETEDPAVQRDAIEAATAQSRELLEIFGALLRIAEVEGMAPRVHFQPVALAVLVEELVETYRPDMELSGHRIEAQVAAGVVMNGDRRLLQQAMTNLLDNVLRHTPPGTNATVSLDTGEGFAVLIVQDDGPGVAPADASRLFQRFARVERSRSSSGHGLGLALVSAIVAAHQGDVALVPGSGFQIRLRLPLAA